MKVVRETVDLRKDLVLDDQRVSGFRPVPEVSNTFVLSVPACVAGLRHLHYFLTERPLRRAASKYSALRDGWLWNE